MDDPSKLEHQETDNVLDDLEWDRPEILETAWAKTQSARPLAAKTFGGSRRTAMSLQRSNTLPLLPGDNVGCLTDSSPEFSRSSGRSFLSDHSSSESFVPPPRWRLCLVERDGVRHGPGRVGTEPTLDFRNDINGCIGRILHANVRHATGDLHLIFERGEHV